MKNETIVDRVVMRLKAQPLGDLITEEDLHDIVKEAIPKTFFENRVIPARDSYSRPETKEPAILEIMRELLRDAAKDAAQRYIAENAEAIADFWKKVCDEGLAEYIRQYQAAEATKMIRETINASFHQINEDRRQRGMPPLGIFV